MAYEKVGFADGTTPLDMENFNHMDDGIAQNAEDIAQVNADLTGLHCKYVLVSRDDSLDVSYNSFLAVACGRSAMGWSFCNQWNEAYLSNYMDNYIEISVSNKTATIKNINNGYINLFLLWI